jgi:hypothetical protein
MHVQQGAEFVCAELLTGFDQTGCCACHVVKAWLVCMFMRPRATQDLIAGSVRGMHMNWVVATGVVCGCILDCKPAVMQGKMCSLINE